MQVMESGVLIIDLRQAYLHGFRSGTSLYTNLRAYDKYTVWGIEEVGIRARSDLVPV